MGVFNPKKKSCCHISLLVNDKSKDIRQSFHHHHLHYIRKSSRQSILRNLIRVYSEVQGENESGG
ncbi:uncharacterized protein P174DRAFT_440490 [Aspergillus novofumigatus IBT 16806]|uniref:Uncharacterized protein n=1 Tax=Aspergillus novofumigatus (strain IBT 16806) TaxID=1392255 RepID=A0A2I1CE41_ASPN1|nr:uncharacterized protein P174DRAFT_440490 [Aspergillus novofumigatus IBT 16806]PKX95875.1 hypothetical protein P174DRAFT_440490 [Aspergillus novofumigatus IBT 16806]